MRFVSATPILDLEANPPEPRISKLPLIVGGFIGALIGLSAAIFPPSWPRFNGLFLLPAFYVVIAVHEVGHLIAAKLTGMDVGGIVIGGFRILKSGERWTFRFEWRHTLGGFAKPLPQKDQCRAAQFAWMVAGGPIASIASAVVLGLLVLRYGGGTGGWRSCLFGVFILSISSLIPASNGPNKSDGARLLLLLRHPEQSHSWMAVLKVQTEESRGVMPADWDAELVRQMLACDPSAAEYPYCQLLGYYRSADEDEKSPRLELLENALARSQKSGKMLRHALFLEAASTSAMILQNVEHANVWLDRARKVRRPDSEASVQAAIAYSQGHYQEALAQLALARAWVEKRKLDSGLARFAKKQYDRYETRCREALSSPKIDL
jgi:hypothetical protein